MLTAARRTRAGDAATRVVLSTFRATGLLLSAGDALAAAEGLTSTRWQVLGAFSLAGRPLTVPQIARRMGLTRQSVHATVKRLMGEGLVELRPNEDHRRSPLVRLTETGKAAYAAIDRRQAAWINDLSAGIPESDLQTASGVLGELSRRLEGAKTRRREGER